MDLPAVRKAGTIVRTNDGLYAYLNETRWFREVSRMFGFSFRRLSCGGFKSIQRWDLNSVEAGWWWYTYVFRVTYQSKCTNDGYLWLLSEREIQGYSNVDTQFPCLGYFVRFERYAFARRNQRICSEISKWNVKYKRSGSAFRLRRCAISILAGTRPCWNFHGRKTLVGTSLYKIHSFSLEKSKPSRAGSYGRGSRISR